MPAAVRSHVRERLRGPSGILLVIVAAALIGLFDVPPVRSQLPVLTATYTTDDVPADDAWAAVWSDAPAVEVPLSAQSISFPFGGGAVTGVTVRSLYDDDRIFLALEWSDPAPSDTVNGVEEFTDAVAVQFPAEPGASPPYTMGARGQPVNIWQWKAVWQADIERGFETTIDRYPNTYADIYPNSDESLYANPAGHVGNLLAERSHASPVENLVAEGFGTLTGAEVQDVEGSGAWRDGTWRVVFARDLEAAAPGLATFTPGETALVAFAVWEGAATDRNGQKSIAQFIELDLGAGVEPPPPVVPPPLGPSEKGIPWALLALILGALSPLVAMALAARRNSTA